MQMGKKGPPRDSSRAQCSVWRAALIAVQGCAHLHLRRLHPGLDGVVRRLGAEVDQVPARLGPLVVDQHQHGVTPHACTPQLHRSNVTVAQHVSTADRALVASCLVADGSKVSVHSEDALHAGRHRLSAKFSQGSTKASLKHVIRAAPLSSAIRNWRDSRRALSSNPRCGADSRPGLPGLPAHAREQR